MSESVTGSRDFSLGSAVLLCLFPVTLLLEVALIIHQCKARKESFKNYRHFLHVSLLCQTIAYIGRCIDLAALRPEQKVNIAELQVSCANYCDWSASIQIFFESFGYMNLASYLYLLRASATNATANLSCLRVKLLVTVVSISLLAILCMVHGPKLGLESTLTCGVEFSPTWTEYTELARNWHVVLVPYLLWKSTKLTESVPGFIKQSFSYYALQVSFYVAFFAIRMTISFSLQCFSIVYLIGNDGFPTAANLSIRDTNLFLYTVEVQALTLLISLDEAKFYRLLSWVFCGRQLGLIRDLQMSL